jgi:hypothetical protein
VLANPVVFEVVRRRQFPIVAAGTLAAIQSGRTGDYNIVDGSVVVHPHRRRSHGDPDDPAPVAEWLPFLAAEIDAALAERGARAVEAPVAKHGPLDPLGPQDRSLQVPHRLEGTPKGGGRIRVERVVLGLDEPTGPGEEARPGVGLGDDPPNRQPSDALEQVIGCLGSEPVGGCESLVELAGVGELGKRRQLVDHHLGLGPADGVDHGVPVQRVEDHGRPRPPRAGG